MRVKICGITRLEDAELAATLGAWAIGFNFWPGSKRHVDSGVAAGIARVVRRRIDVVGVFVNQPLDEIAGLVDVLGLDHVQLHGDEGPSFCQAVAQRTGAKVIKAARIAHAADLKDMDRFHTDLHLLDAPAQEGEFGGTGKTWDWGLLRQRRNRIPFLLAGGLTPDNVAEAITTAQPWGIDVASGVEDAPGVKSEAKLRALFEAVDELAPATAPPARPATPDVLVYPPKEADEHGR
jgi:phosphoribosylanthranilate isomerase